MLSKINRSWTMNLASYALGNSLVHQQWHSPSGWNMGRYFYHDFESDFMNNMDHMRISGTNVL